MFEDRVSLKRSFEQKCGISRRFSKTAGIGGLLRQIPEHFIVWEVDSEGERVTENYTPQETGGLHTIFTLKKTNVDTPTALAKISRALNRPRKAFGYAGLKDARAVTYQSVSAWEVSPAELQALSLNDIEIFHPIKAVYGLKIGSHWGNAFQIVVSGINCPQKEAIARVTNIQQELIELGGIPNYFGMQRFGEIRPISHLIGRALIEGRPKDAAMLYLTEISVLEHLQLQKCRLRLKKTWNLKDFLQCLPSHYEYERILAQYLLKRQGDGWGAIRALPKDIVKLFLHAFQSYLFNKVLSELLRNPEELSPELVLPLPGSNFQLSSFVPSVREIFERILEEENLTLEQFGMMPLNIRLRSIQRGALVQPRYLKFAPCEKENIQFNFALSAGSYATSLLREFMNH
ncbi:MAG: tRNA pseudouridine(13) synthase TruD [Candidatus Heimdallarchaeota archaeon]